MQLGADACMCMHPRYQCSSIFFTITLVFLTFPLSTRLLFCSPLFAICVLVLHSVHFCSHSILAFTLITSTHTTTLSFTLSLLAHTVLCAQTHPWKVLFVVSALRRSTMAAHLSFASCSSFFKPCRSQDSSMVISLLGHSEKRAWLLAWTQDVAWLFLRCVWGAY
jgi:hypothetical protein